ncbi:MAG: hypothetical protein M1823_000492, partial [Watsoniomyces obsoletus]
TNEPRLWTRILIRDTPPKSPKMHPDTMEDVYEGTDECAEALATPIPPRKSRAMSDTPPVLLPAPIFHETARTAKDDISVMPSTNVTPQHPPLLRGLSLQMPAQGSTTPSGLSIVKRVPLSPKVEASYVYGSPTSVLPRRSRGIDFSRACTNLHHSTLADHSSPDSSPTLSARPSAVSHRRGFHHPWNSFGSPHYTALSSWSNAGHGEVAGMASSISSVNMLDSDEDNRSWDEDEKMSIMDTEDVVMTTPQGPKEMDHLTPRGGTSAMTMPKANVTGITADWQQGPAARSLLNFGRGMTWGRGKTRDSSSASASGGSSMPSPGSASPAAMRGVEGTSSFLTRDVPRKGRSLRRESLSIGADDLRLSSGGESDDGGHAVANQHREKRGVIKRAVTRRGNLLVGNKHGFRRACANALQPKTKNFARIKAALMEEGAPVDSEVKREAEVVRQVRERDDHIYSPSPASAAASTSGGAWPGSIPAALGMMDSPENESGDDMGRGDVTMKGTDRLPTHAFNLQAKRLSGGKEFWENFDSRTRTPPPPLFPRATSVAISDDTSMDSPVAPTPLSFPSHLGYAEQSFKSSRSSQSSGQQQQPSAEEISQKIRRKRARDDDLDPLSLKRRAVSPGVSVQNSPIMAESPSQRESGWWGLPVNGRESWPGPGGKPQQQQPGGRTNSVASSASGSVKRIGFQGMNDTNDGLQRMSIE